MRWLNWSKKQVKHMQIHQLQIEWPGETILNFYESTSGWITNQWWFYKLRANNSTCEQTLNKSKRKKGNSRSRNESARPKTDLTTVFFGVGDCWKHSAKCCIRVILNALCSGGIQLKCPDFTGLSNAKVLERYITLLWMDKPHLSLSLTHSRFFSDCWTEVALFQTEGCL